MHRCAEQTHFINVQCLTLRVFLPHKYFTFHAHQCRRCRCRHSVLTGSGLRNDTGFPHFLRQQYLTEHVVDLMCAGMVQILALQVNLRAAKILRHMCRIVQAGGPTGILIEQLCQLPVKFRIIFIMKVCLFQFDHCIHQCLWDILASVDSKSSF